MIDKEYRELIGEATEQAQRLSASIAEIVAKNQEAKAFAVVAALLAVALTSLAELDQTQAIAAKVTANYLAASRGLKQPIPEYAIPKHKLEEMFPSRAKEVN